MTKPCWKVASVVLILVVVLYWAPALLPGENDTISTAAEDADASSDILTITTYTGFEEGHVITFPDGTKLAIDCGYKRVGADIVTESHFHRDHCLECRSSEARKSAQVYNRNNVAPGDVIYSDDDRGITVTVVAANGVVIGQEPAGPYACDSGYENLWSMALLVKYRGFDYLTGGDLSAGVELALGAALKERGIHVDVLKVSHHGSATSTPLGYLMDILPEYVVIAGGGSEPAGGILWKLVYAGVRTIYYAHSYPVYEGYPICVATDGAVVTTTDGYTYSISGGGCGDGPVDVDETPTPTPTETPTETSTPTMTPTPTNTPTMSPTATPTATPIPALAVLPGPLAVGQNFSVYLGLSEDITQPFDFYLFVDTPAGPYTLYLDWSVKKGITPLYRNVRSFTKGYVTMVRPAVKVPVSMEGTTVTFYAAFVQAGKMSPVRTLSDLTSNTPYVIVMDSAQATINP